VRLQRWDPWRMNDMRASVDGDYVLRSTALFLMRKAVQAARRSERRKVARLLREMARDLVDRDLVVALGVAARSLEDALGRGEAS
jgi:hypothetical protein